MNSPAVLPRLAVVLCLLLGCSACCGGRYWSVRSRRPALLSRPVQQGVSQTADQPGGPVAAKNRLRLARPRLGQRISRRLARRRPRLWSLYQQVKCEAWTDCENYYRWDVARELLLGIAAASVLANTSLDRDFQAWYQNDVRSSGTEDLARAWEVFGNGAIIIPVTAGLGLAGNLYGHTPCGSTVGQFGLRAGRAYLVGAPSMVFMQFCLGGSRPGETKYASRWRPFEDDNGVAGHGFIGAVPFITAARMAENPYLKGALYLCSVLPAWARVDQDAHYLSQAWLGWWMAYLACQAVDQTEYQSRSFSLTPVTTPEVIGIGLLYRR